MKNAAIKYFGESAKVFLFGSRADDSKKGGDIDLYVETDFKHNLIEKKIKMLGQLHLELGEQKIDIIINDLHRDKFIYKIAQNEGVLL
ncbi:MAG: nucleotidyltransferase domain-containing protein [Bacteroidota bacterium]